MTVKAKDVFVGAPDQLVTGAILTGPETDIIPDTIDDFVATGLTDSGYVGEDGVTITPTESTESIKDWSLKVIRKILTEFDSTIAWAHLALDEFSLKNYMGDDNVDVTAATATKGTLTRAAIAGEMRPVKAWYFKIKDGARRALIMVPHGQITERGEISLLASAAITLPVTLTTYPDAAGKNIYIFLDDGVVASA
ncbi:phage tail tube protein [Microbacterium arabinogalactanolyticum]|uniref:phage tail tube protein n=1 Tax=Microbacterium arabinogalactanolyticum TaxID=69365 RepID=UPI004044804B